MSLSLKQLEFCHSLSGEALLAAPLDDSDPLAAIKQLRKECSAEMAAAIMTVRKVRHKAAASGKFCENFAQRMLADDRMLQQSSSFAAALYLAEKFVELACEKCPQNPLIYDLCCGLGANSIAMALVGQRRGIDLQIMSFDISPEACFCARHNAIVAGVPSVEGGSGVELKFICQDVTTLEIPPEALVFIDPDRRADGRRSVLPSDCVPGDDFFRALIDTNPAGAIKLSPACSAAIFDDWAVSFQYLSEASRARQLLLWWPQENFDAGAVILHDNATDSALPVNSTFIPVVCDGEKIPAARGKKFILVPDAAVLAAKAVDSLVSFLNKNFDCAAAPLSETASWLGCDKLIDSPAATCFEVIEEAKPRESDILEALKKLDPGQVEVKTHQIKLNTDSLGRKFSSNGPNRLTVLWYNDGKSHVYICKRC